MAKTQTDIAQMLRDGMNHAMVLHIRRLIDRNAAGEDLTSAEWKQLELAKDHIFHIERPNIVRTMREVGLAFGVSERTVKNWRRLEPRMPITEKREYDLIEIGVWQYRRDNASGYTAVQGKLDFKQQQQKVELELKRIALAEKRDELVSRSEVDEVAIKRILAAKKVLENIGHNLAPDLIRPNITEIEVRRIIDRDINLALKQLAGRDLGPTETVDTKKPKRRKSMKKKAATKKPVMKKPVMKKSKRKPARKPLRPEDE